MRTFVLLCLSILAGCGEVRLELEGSSSAPTAPSAGRYAFARDGTRLIAMALDAQMPGPFTVIDSLRSEPDVAVAVERPAVIAKGTPKHHDILLFNGGRVYWLSGLSNGREPLAQELRVPGPAVRACGHAAVPDDAALSFIRAREDDVIREVAVHFIAATGCIDAAGDTTLSVPLAQKTALVHARRQIRTGLQPDGSALGTLTLGGANLEYTPGAQGMGLPQRMPPAAEDVGRVIAWRRLAQDQHGVLLCASLDGEGRCAIYHFEAQATPQLTKLSADDFPAVKMGSMAAGRGYILSRGPMVGGQPQIIESIHAFTLTPPWTVRAAFTLSPEFRAISLDQSLLLQAQDTVRYSQYRLVDVATGAVWNTDFVTYGSGASATYADHRMGCVVSEYPPTVPQWAGCAAHAWLTPNLSSGVRDRSVYLRDAADTITHSWSFNEVAGPAGFVGYESAVHLWVGIQRADGSRQIWRLAHAQGGAPTMILSGDVALYGSIRPRGSVL